MQDLLEYITPALIALIGAILTYIMNRASAAFTLATGMKIESRHREALHSALMTGAKSALAGNGKKAVSDLKAAAVAYAREAVPDAISAIVPGDGVLDKLAERYVVEALEKAGLFGAEQTSA